MTTPNNPALKAHQWTRSLAQAVAGLLAFETLTGVANYLLPFSVPNQVMVLLHTIGGLVLIAPFAWYQISHWRMYRAMRFSHVMLTGYFAMVATVLLLVSGVVLTAQAALGTHISRAWDVKIGRAHV